MSDSDDDYMSDKILGLVPDKRPGLVHGRVARERSLAAAHKQKNEQSKRVSKAVLEAQKRSEGLKTELGAGNKGFALLAKMGYKPGTALGKSGTGRIAPVEVELKTCKGGLGLKQERERKQQARSRHREQLLEARRARDVIAQRDFLRMQQQRHVDKASERDLDKSQKACEQLDSQHGVLTPAEKFFWPAAPTQNNDEEVDSDVDEEEEEEDRFEAHEKLEVLTTYLRSKYHYCIWCGIKYNDFDDMQANCPGGNADAHDDL